MLWVERKERNQPCLCFCFHGLLAQLCLSGTHYFLHEGHENVTGFVIEIPGAVRMTYHMPGNGWWSTLLQYHIPPMKMVPSEGYYWFNNNMLQDLAHH